MRTQYTFLICILCMGFSFGQSKDIFTISRSGTVTEAQVLLSQNPKLLNDLNQSGFTPLILACYRGNSEVARFLIDQKPDLNYVSEMGTALMAAVVQGNPAIVQCLLEHGANPNIPDPAGNTSLIYAVQFANAEVISLLLKFKADKAMKDKAGKTAFEHAVFAGNQTIINLLN